MGLFLQCSATSHAQLPEAQCAVPNQEQTPANYGSEDLLCYVCISINSINWRKRQHKRNLSAAAKAKDLKRYQVHHVELQWPAITHKKSNSTNMSCTGSPIYLKPSPTLFNRVDHALVINPSSTAGSIHPKSNPTLQIWFHQATQDQLLQG